MRKLLLLLFVLSATTTWGSHFTGAEIRYVPEGTKYRVTLILYKTCESGVAQLPTNSSLSFISTCGANFSRNLPVVSQDTLFEMYACGGLASCGAPTVFNYQIVATYSDTVSLTPCASWKMVMSSCCRSGSSTNISSSSSAGIYVEAFLNNLAAPNASARLANVALPVLGTGGTTTISLQATDLQGDSIAYELIAAREGVGVPVTPSPVMYSAGFSALQPLGGTATVLNSAAATLALTPAFQGRFSIAMRIKDYRNGQLVGYSEREWEARAIGGAPNPAPLPASGTVFQHTSCPGQSHNLSFTFNDPNDSVKIVATPDNNVSWPMTITGGNGLGSATINLSWTTPSNLNVSTTPYFYIRLKVRDTACVRGIAWYDVLVRTAYCSTDTVWAGDADANKVVDLYDPLAVAVAFGKTGPVRPAASTAWTAQACPNWATSFLNGVNHKHADCDGNGTVNNTDLNAITSNYGMTHPKGDDAEQPKTTGLPDLYFDHTGVSANRGGTVTIPIKLGSAGSTMANLYGLAARIQIQNVTAASTPVIAYPTSWIGTATNTLRFTKSSNPSVIDWAYARTTGTNISGDGTIAQLQLAIPASTPVGTKMVLRFLQPRLINAAGTEITAYNVLSDTVTVLAEAGIDDASTSLRSVYVVPNPSGRDASLYLTTTGKEVEISIADAVGREVWMRTVNTSVAGEQKVSLPAAQLPAGMYLIRLMPVDGSAARVVKWIRE